jgi:hypothetical protein
MEAEAGTVQAAAAEPDRSGDGKAASQSREEEPMGNAGSSSNPSAKAAEAEWAPGHDQSAGVEPREPWSKGGEVVRGAEGRSSPDAAPGASAEEPARADPESRALLEQILRELRRDRAYREDFSLSRMLAAVMQMIAVGCVAFALLMAGSAASLLGWLLGAVLAQLSVIALLIIHGQR